MSENKKSFPPNWHRRNLVYVKFADPEHKITLTAKAARANVSLSALMLAAAQKCHPECFV